ncbi:trifunctional nucleotide phosphoesterase protein YfkN precursor [bacterium BMS3Bbin02]|nr:trifunctional nucleotide phosphoesterase protein YfkN precursor [bacterium BMS3Bbin02]
MQAPEAQHRKGTKLKRLQLLLSAFVLVVPLLAFGPAAVAASDSTNFYTVLSGDNQPTPVATDSTGAVGLSLSADEATLNFVAVANDLVGATAAHIHVGPAGANAPAVAPLFGPNTGLDVDGVLARGSITEADLLSGTMADLVTALRAGNAYVNVHTTGNPSGEIRGQIDALATFTGTRFTDDDGNIHERNIELIAAAEITKGNNPPANDQFGPDDSVTRGQMAAFLARALGLETPAGDFFTDDDGSIFEDNINAIAAAGITLGCNPPDNDNFCPNDTVTRGQMATFLVRTLDLAPAPMDFFTDDAGSVHEGNINALRMAGITVGCNPPASNLFCGESPVLRAEMATFLARGLGWASVEPLYALTIMHNNDGESELLDDSGVGGVARFMTVLGDIRSAAAAVDVPTILLSSGDNFLPGPEFNASLDAGKFFDQIALEAFDYTAVAIGNHEFDFGPDVLADFLSAYTSPPPYLSSNLDFSNEPALDALATAGVLKPSTMIDVDGRKIGIVGATTPLITSISSIRDVIVDPDYAATIQTEIDALILAGAEIIVTVSHLQDVTQELALAEMLSGVDIMIAGGGDELLANPGTTLIPGDESQIFGTYPLWATNADGMKTPIVTTNGQYRYVGKLTVAFTADGELAGVDTGSGPVAVMGQTQNASLLTDVENPVSTFVAGLATTVVATSEVALDGVRGNVRTMETNLGNLAADSLLWQATQLAAGFGVAAPDVALQNGGGMRNDAVIPVGDFTELDTFDVLPFPNFVTIIPDIPRSQFKEILENAVSQVETVSGRFAQVAGFSFTYDPNGTAQVVDDDGTVLTPGTRIQTVTLDDSTSIVAGGTVVAGADLTIATIDFLARGGDQYPYRDAPITLLGVSYQQALSNYLQAALVDGGLAGTITAADYPEGGEGRITAL